MAELSYSMKMTLDAIKLVSGANEARDALQKTFDGASAKARQAEKAFQEASAALQNIKADPDASKAIIDRATADAARLQAAWHEAQNEVAGYGRALSAASSGANLAAARDLYVEDES